MISYFRITALDPAFPPFYPAITTKAISKHDAVMVDVIHTDAGLYGAPKSTGTVDFWPNGGTTLQPGCPKRNYRMLTDIGNINIRFLALAIFIDTFRIKRPLQSSEIMAILGRKCRC